ncbi:hypothetical protein PUN28_010634 [Cardiocondyla obscurior]|uniref:Secreted protein n=1 Tax=Cardiocondyla obscurior TaxID=286306 RepID=A0AAW2FLX2_9HYME
MYRKCLCVVAAFAAAALEHAERTTLCARIDGPSVHASVTSTSDSDSSRKTFSSGQDYCYFPTRNNRHAKHFNSNPMKGARERPWRAARTHIIMHVIRVNVHSRDISADICAIACTYVPLYDTRVIRLALAILRRCMTEPPPPPSQSYIWCSETV